MKNSDNIIIRWNGSDPNTYLDESWFVRGLRPDGSFYGEIKVDTDGLQAFANVQGNLKDGENREVRELIDLLSRNNSQISMDTRDYSGLLASGSVSNPTIMLKYSRESHQSLEIGSHFERLIDILRPYMTTK